MKIAVRKWRMEDAEDLAVILNNPKIHENLRDGIPFPYTESDAGDFIGTVLNAAPGSRYDFAVTADGRVCGSIGVFRKENVHRLTAEMGYFVAEPYWNKGIATEAVRQVCNYIFANTDIVRIFAQPYAHNHASCRILAKAGFLFEGILHKNAIKAGKIVDMMLYAIIRPDL